MPSNIKMITFVLNWLQCNVPSGQKVNWTVAITGEPAMIISKVGGVSSRTEGMKRLGLSIKEQQWRNLKGVYLAKTFTQDGASNHAEMCILAAADSLRQRVVDMGCASPNCEACANMLWHAGVRTMSVSGGAQTGWVHPRGPMALGGQLNAPWDRQIEELDRFNEEGAPHSFDYRYTQHLNSKPTGGYEGLT